jgi:hypothetical protein
MAGVGGSVVPSPRRPIVLAASAESRPSRGRFATLDMSATAQGISTYRGDGEEQGIESVQVSLGQSCH